MSRPSLNLGRQRLMHSSLNKSLKRWLSKILCKLLRPLSKSLRLSYRWSPQKGASAVLTVCHYAQNPSIIHSCMQSHFVRHQVATIGQLQARPSKT